MEAFSKLKDLWNQGQTGLNNFIEENTPEDYKKLQQAKLQAIINSGKTPEEAAEQIAREQSLVQSGGMMMGSIGNVAGEAAGPVRSLLGAASPNAKAIEAINKARNARLDKLKGLQDIFSGSNMAKAKEIIGK